MLKTEKIKEIEHTLHKSKHTYTNKHIKIFLTSLVITDMNIENSMRHHQTLTRMVKLQNIDNIKCSYGGGETGSFIHCYWEIGRASCRERV